MPTDTEDHEIPGRSNATARRSRPERNAVTESVSVQKERQRPRGAKHRSNGNRRIPGRSNATESEAYPKERSDGKRQRPKGATRRKAKRPKESSGFPEGATATERRSRPERSNATERRSRPKRNAVTESEATRFTRSHPKDSA